MPRKKKVDSKETGLEVGLLIGKHLFNTEHLHYGYWADGLEPSLKNLPQAQEKYSQFLMSQIPNGIKTILDVGCGVGRFAYTLINRGYQVDCVSPSTVLTEHARELLGDQCHIYECGFQNIETEKRYDLILFSESFQYINPEKALQNVVHLLNEKGSLLICDFFKTDAKGKSVLGGGHKLAEFYDTISRYPFKPVKDIDITKEIAPNLDIVDHIMMNVGLPVWNLILKYLDTNYRMISKLLRWKYRKKIEKINDKYFSGKRNAANFEIYKSYRLLLYKKTKS